MNICVNDYEKWDHEILNITYSMKFIEETIY